MTHSYGAKYMAPVRTICHVTALPLRIGTFLATLWLLALAGVAAAQTTVPEAPTITVTRGGSGQLVVAWNAPGNGGGSITGYQARASLDGGANWSDPIDLPFENPSAPVRFEATFPELVNGTSYTFQIRAVNSAGTGGWSVAVDGTPATLPGTPTAVTLSLADNGRDVKVVWTAPTSDGGAAVTYTVETSRGGTVVNTRSGISGTSATIDSGLLRGVEHSIRVQAVNDVGAGGWSVPATITPRPATLPGRPTGVAVWLGMNPLEIEVIWSAPASDGGAAITYTVETSRGGTVVDTRSGISGTSATVDSGLVAGVRHSVRVQAVNDVGAGGWSASATIVPVRVPLLPMSVMVEPGDRRLTVRWSAPDRPVDSYIVEYREAGSRSWTPSHSISKATFEYEINRLTNGGDYEVRVGSVHDSGNVAWSRITDATPIGPPAAPEVRLSGGTGSISVDWSAPLDGGSPIIGYELQYRQGNQPYEPSTFVDAATTSHIIGRRLEGGYYLQHNRFYTVRVRAINRVGGGAWNARNSIFLRAAVPAAPNIYVVPYTNRIDVTWDPPYDGGSRITSYDAWLCARYHDGGRPLCQIGQNVTHKSATFGYYVPGAHYYTVGVRAINSLGKGPWTEQLVAHGAPFPPFAFISRREDGKLTVEWRKPKSDNGQPVTAYHIYVDGARHAEIRVSDLSDAEKPRYTIDGLSNGRVYAVNVAAVNSQGIGGWSRTMHAAPVSAPGRPGNVWLETGDAPGTLDVSWSAPDSSGVAIRSYAFRYRLVRNNSFGSWMQYFASVSGSQTTHTLEHLRRGVYQVQVAARSAFGVGDWSDTLPTGEVVGVPTVPTNIDVRDGDVRGVIDVSWSAPHDDGGSAVTQYQLRYWDERRGTWSPLISTGSTGTEYRLTGLHGDTSYEVQVRAQSAYGNSSWARWGGVPGAPRNLTLRGGESGTLVVSWLPPADMDERRLTRYRVRYKAGSFVGNLWTRGPVTTYTLTRLQNGVVYEVSVAAQTSDARGLFSAAVEGIPATPPGKPAVSLTSGSATTINVAWTASDDDGGSPVTGYDLRWRQQSATDWIAVSGLAADSARYTITGLKSTTAYEVQVRAFNATVKGAYSATRTAETGVASDDATLSGLSVTDGNGAKLDILPASFSPETFIYLTNVGRRITSLNVTATVNERNATLSGELVRPNGSSQIVSMTSGTAVAVTGLETGTNQFFVRVTAEDGRKRLVYELEVKRTALPEVTITASVDDEDDLETTGGPSSLVYGIQIGTALRLSSTASDPDGGGVTYAWTASDHRNDVTASVFAGVTNAATATFNASTPGDYTVTLTVTDDEGETGFDSLRVRVSEGAPNQAPAVTIGQSESSEETAGSPSRLPRSGRSACRTAFCVEVNADLMLTGRASDGDGRIASYTWRVLTNGGRNDVTGDVLSSADTAAVTFNASAPGEYLVVLHVLDDDNATATATMRVTAWEPSSDATLSALSVTDGNRSQLRLTPSPFLATTYEYLTIVDKGTASVNATAVVNDFGARLTGSLLRAGSDTPETITMTSGEKAPLTDLAPGDNLLNVMVTAQDGTTQDYTLRVIRMAAPVARINPGETQRIAAGTNLTLDASLSTDPDGGAIVAYAWYVVDSRGRNVTTAVLGTDVSGAAVTFNAATAGDYTVLLSVLDDENDMAEVALTVSVEASLSVADASVTEGVGAKLVFAVSLSGAASVPVTVDWATSDGTAVAGEDYEAASGTLSFAAGETGKTVEVTVLDDAHDEETETLTLTLSNASGAPIADGVALGQIHNADPMPAAWLARFGRTVAEQALEGISARMKGPRAAGFDGSLAGQAFGSGDETTTERIEVPEKAARDSTGAARSMTARELLQGSSFTLTGEADSNGGSTAVWGRGAETRFDGREDTLDLEGTVTSGMLGADYARDRWTVGLALMQSAGEGSYTDRDTDAEGAGGMAGKIDSSLTAALPYAAWQMSENYGMWGVAGFGSGEMTLTPKDGTAIEVDLDWSMAAAGIRSELLSSTGSQAGLALTADALWSRTNSERTLGLAATEVDATRLRVGLEGRWTVMQAGSGRLVPRLAIGARHDGGDAETGTGVELGGGITWSDPDIGISLEVDGRTLIAHEADGLRDRGIAVSLSFDPDPSTKRGLSFGVRQDWGGRSDGGIDALFAPDPLSRRSSAGMDEQRWEVAAAYGLPILGGGFTTGPHLNLGLSSTVRDYSLGWKVISEGHPARSFSLGLVASRQESTVNETEHRIGFEFKAHW